MELRPLLGLACIAPVSAFATDYLTAEQAQRLIFPGADQFEPRNSLLEPALVQKLGGSSAFANGHFSWTRVRKNGQTLGVVAMDEVVGKFERIGYAVGINADGSIRQIEILSYRESHGGEVRLPAWREQFAGKTATDALSVGEDIANISGATLSCTHITDGVRRLVTVFEALRRAHQLT